MKSLRKATRAWSTVAYQAITASNCAVLRTTWANFPGEIRCEVAGRTRVPVVTVLIASSFSSWSGGPAARGSPGRARYQSILARKVQATRARGGAAPERGEP